MEILLQELKQKLKYAEERENEPYQDECERSYNAGQVTALMEVIELINTKDKNIINFNDIKDDYIAIEFNNFSELNKLVKYLKAYGYDYGTGVVNNDLNEISEHLGINYFSDDNKFLSLDRSRKNYPRNYVSCGKCCRDICYKFKEINWNIIN